MTDAGSSFFIGKVNGIQDMQEIENATEKHSPLRKMEHKNL